MKRIAEAEFVRTPGVAAAELLRQCTASNNEIASPRKAPCEGKKMEDKKMKTGIGENQVERKREADPQCQAIHILFLFFCPNLFASPVRTA